MNSPSKTNCGGKSTKNEGKIQRLYELHIEGKKAISGAYELSNKGEPFLDEEIIALEHSINEELKVVWRVLRSMSDALEEISEDIRREKMYLDELRNSTDPQFQKFLALGYGDLLCWLVKNNEHVRETYKVLSERKKNFDRNFEKLQSLTDIYPKLNENMDKMWKILLEISEEKK